MCNGLVVRETTPSKSARGPVWFWAVSIAICREREKGPKIRGPEFPGTFPSPLREAPGVQLATGAWCRRGYLPPLLDSYPSYLGTSGPDQYPTVRQWKSLPCPQRRNSSERSSTAKFDQTNSFESLDNRRRCSGLSDSESSSEGSPEAN